MGQRYEKSKKNVSENKKTLERLHSDKDTLQNEYASLSLLDSIQGLLDDEATDAIQVVRNVGEIESQRIESETNTAEEEKKQITGEINGEIAKLNAGLEKLRKSGNIEFGKRAVEQSSQEYKKQIDKFKSLIGELGEHASDIGAAGMSSVEGISGVVAENTSDTPVPLNEGEAVFIPHYNTSDLSPQALYASGSGEYTAMIDSLVASNVDYRPIEQFNGMRTQEDIVQRLSGGDLTEGSCSSLALAYAGNKGGYDVLDFRDGESRDFFSTRSSIQEVASLPGVQSTILNGRNDIATANQLLDLMAPGKEYYLATGQHASIVRRTASGYEYLELQHPSDGNGWHRLDDGILEARFGCRSMHMSTYSNYLIDVDSLANNREFLSVLGYINTADYAQRKGGAGYVR